MYYILTSVHIKSKKKVEGMRSVINNFFIFLNESIDDSQFIYALIISNELELSKLNKDLIHYYSIETLLNRRFKMVSEDPNRVNDGKKFLVVDSEDSVWFADEELTLIFFNKLTFNIDDISIDSVVKTDTGSLEYFFKKYTDKIPVYK